MIEESYFRSIYEYIDIPVLVMDVDAAGEFVFGSLNPACEKAIGFRREAVVGKRPEAISGISRAGASVLRANCRRCLETNDIIHCREPFIEGGQGIWWLTQLAPVRDTAGSIVRIIGTLVNIGELKRAEVALRESELKYRLLVEQSLFGIMIVQDGRLLYANEVITGKSGYSAEELMSLAPEQLMGLIHPHDRDAVWNRMLSRLSGKKEPERNECRFMARDGSHYWADVHTKIIEYLGKPALQLCIVDISERKQAEEAFRRSEKEKTILNQIANIFLTIPDEAMYGEVLEIVLSVMRSRFGIFGYIGETGDLVVPSLTREIWDECQVTGKSIVFPTDSWGDSLWGRAIREKKVFYSEGPFHTPEGHIDIHNFLAVPIVYGEETIGLISVGNRAGGYTEEDKNLLARIASRVSPILHARLQRDMQERQRMAAEAHLRESEEKYRLLVTNADEAILIIQDETIKFPNPKALEMTGYSAAELAQISIIDLVHAADKSTVQQRYIGSRGGGRPAERYPFRIVDKKGKDIWVQFTTTPIIWEKKPGTLCFLTDVTEEKKLEAQFMQAQKMEAVGQLAGGLAHDFNNMLTLIMGHVEMALTDVAPSDPLHTQLREVDRAVRRSVDLTGQLLAYARKQAIAPRVLDLNNTVSGMLKMLRRLIGEEIDLAWRPGAELWTIKIDPSQIDQVLANLCVNARDAIAGVGKVTIETENITLDQTYCAAHLGFVPGAYVLLAVSDDGCGMDEETQTHLFEPFFTTKGVGQGTGLGLATVYGIVKQNDGFINVYSEPGQGTTFRVYFPANRTTPGKTLVESAGEKPPEGVETVLMVEDEKGILDLGKKILEKYGYTVLIASTPQEAIRLAEAHTGDIHLLITDVVMPEMNGRELAERLVSIRPGLKCLYMSGYTSDVISRRGILEEGVHFIQKPFSIKNLTIGVREALDEKSMSGDF